MPNRFYRRYGKRLFDLMISGIGLILLSPLLVSVAILILVKDGFPVFYRQKRIGRAFTSFQIIKLRTMVKNADRIGLSISSADDSRITPIGKFLRRYKFDELPQLINVFKGEMSFVGPRPEVEKYVSQYRNNYSEILTVRPGITDLASIRYKNENEILQHQDNKEKYYIDVILPDKLRLNRYYVQSDFGLIADLRIIFATILGVTSFLNNMLPSGASSVTQKEQLSTRLD